MGLHLISRLYSGANRKTPYFSQVSTSKKRWSTQNLYPPFAEKNPTVAATCNELLCLSYSDRKDLLWNPSTDEYKFLPPSGLKIPPCKDHDSNNNNNRPCICFSMSGIRGLGFDAECQDYKFLRFIDHIYEDEDYYPHGASQQVAVYSLKKNSWKEIQDAPNIGLYEISNERGIHVNGFCYWNAADFVFSFDFVNEKFSTVPYPNISFDGCDYDLIDFDGSLGLVVYPELGSTKLFRFWMMDMEEGRSFWIRKVEFDVCLIGASEPLGFCRNGSSLLLQGIDGALLEYNYIARQLKRIDEIYDYPLEMSLFPYVESKVQLNGEFTKHTLEPKMVESSTVQRKKKKSKR